MTVLRRVVCLTVLVAGAVPALAEPPGDATADAPAAVRGAPATGQSDAADASDAPTLEGETSDAEETPWSAGVSEEQRASALARYKTGNEYFEQQQYSRALTEYRAAIKAWDHPGIRYNMAVCLINLERPLAAFQSLEKGLAFGAAPLGNKLHAEGMTYRKLLRGQLVELTVACSVPGAGVSIDGDRQLACPGETTLIVEPGAHQVIARLDGFMTETRDLQLTPGSTEAVSIDPRPFDEVALERRWPTYVPWAVAGGGLVVGALSAPLFVSANSDVEERDEVIERESMGAPIPEPPEARDLRISADRKRAAAVSLVALGGAAAVSGVVMAFLNRPRPVETAPSVALVPGKGGAQLWLRVSF